MHMSRKSRKSRTFRKAFHEMFHTVGGRAVSGDSGHPSRFARNRGLLRTRTRTCAPSTSHEATARAVHARILTIEGASGLENYNYSAVGLFAVMAVPMQLWFAERQLYWIASGTDMAANRAWIFAHPLHTLMMLFVNIVFLVFVVV